MGDWSKESWRDMALRLNGEKSWGGQQQQQLGKGKGKSQPKRKGKGQETPAKGKGKDSGKGQGKESGKGKGKGKGACWPCPDSRCAAMMGKTWMNAEALCQCGQCGTWREAQVKTAPDTDWLARRAELRAKILAEGGTESPKEEDEEMGLGEEEEKEEDESVHELTP